MKKIKIESKVLKLNEIQLNPDNPRVITEKQLDRLAKSLREFPDMLKMREIIVDENMMILGGNMRYLALKKSGVKDCGVKIVSGLTDEKKREFIVKDNVGFGEWDFDILANEWDDLPLVEWGVDLPEKWFSDNNEGSESDIVPDKDPNILVRLSFHPGLWLGKREEIKSILDKMAATYECTIKVEE